MISECFINNRDAYQTWGVILDSTALSALMSPPPMKPLTNNNSPLINGRQLLAAPELLRVDAREVLLPIALHAPMGDPTSNSLEELLSVPSTRSFSVRLNSFLHELQKGEIIFWTRHQKGVFYRFYYLSCQQFTQCNNKLAKFILKLYEPDPTNRKHPLSEGN